MMTTSTISHQRYHSADVATTTPLLGTLPPWAAAWGARPGDLGVARQIAGVEGVVMRRAAANADRSRRDSGQSRRCDASNDGDKSTSVPVTEAPGRNERVGPRT
ncbi:hypothetical protein [Jiangella gansuensis]|uniref:hypothetical protein n=1 Tax=Jiangella gansuensis TaxID=281473 RepID=UPI0012FA1544|nr:hypothetical protein [Jiangella gansuensis]